MEQGLQVKVPEQAGDRENVEKREQTIMKTQKEEVWEEVVGDVEEKDKDWVKEKNSINNKKWRLLCQV
jgi:hypothetical protein